MLKKITLTHQIHDIYYYSDMLYQQNILDEYFENLKSISEKVKAESSHHCDCCKNSCMNLDDMKEEFEEEKDEIFDEKIDNIEEELDMLENEIDNEKEVEMNDVDFQIEENNKKNMNKNKDDPFLDPKNEEKIIKLDLNNKDDVMKIMNNQNLIEGYWDINEKTMNIKNKYEKEFIKLKKLYNNDIIVMTIIVIYFINNNYKEIINELLMIINKGKLFIQKKTGDEYDNIIKITEI